MFYSALTEKSTTLGEVAIHMRKTSHLLLYYPTPNLIVHIKQTKIVISTTSTRRFLQTVGTHLRRAYKKIDYVLDNLDDDSLHMRLFGDFYFPDEEWPTGRLLSGMSWLEQRQLESVQN